MMPFGESLLGQIRAVYLGRGTDKEILRRKVASGGAVTAMLTYALEKGLIDGIVTSKRTKGLEGEAVVARTKEELLETAGNRWSIVPFAARIKAKIEEEDLKKVAVVCLPCQAQFFGQMRDFPILEADFGNRIRYIVSLFCMGTFAFEAFLNYLRVKYGVRAEEIVDIKLTRDFLEIHRESGVLTIPLREAFSYLQTGCLVCSDYTGVWSDISAGFVESEPGWTVIITRNQRGEELVRGAENDGYLELRDGSHVLGEVLKGAREKLARAQRNMAQLL
ncbi:coenzyme F420-reducing hydrogenase subunit beta [Thermococcus cleftensis]|uniref:Coenzyme F420-reducing hydrogenase subunit beta n=1 Tax=Thermococcus cleftensis (strain DSM 27260 / KACC 17922 / CL1) TaxID=163003 RepID=I3ZUG8_THECF|nr:Coenzyme F420 hydrogenase/dehydrogenase, beta subunit C-terminal domain [Thermococcus cleftensis]AFL95352.1 coenzyme F420-reducing hydrogenase subunit beta [Thermococcus cleftensis]